MESWKETHESDNETKGVGHSVTCSPSKNEHSVSEWTHHALEIVIRVGIAIGLVTWDISGHVGDARQSRGFTVGHVGSWVGSAMVETNVDARKIARNNIPDVETT